MNYLKGAELIKKFEGLSLVPYLCPAGVPTIGYGNTYYEDGKKVTMNDPAITKERAEQLLNKVLTDIFIPGVKKRCPNLDKYEDKFAAILSFAYNLGLENLGSSTLLKKVNAEDWVTAKTEIVRWVNANGKVLKGLIIRRNAERDLL